MQFDLNLNCSVIKELLQSYCNAFGQRINYDKLSLFFSTNSPSMIKEEVYSFLHVTAVENPGPYLGLLILWGRSKVAALTYIQDRIGQNVYRWKTSGKVAIGIVYRSHSGDYLKG
ncbi:uncharacterized protein LOC129302282 isoform X2 [Prosopis cineraria]|uniref:uncharacterized protein LOC129302282 isoform X2 n=1 Tax=Prosopis cineraria TaxID=364024 RepID=UPI00240F924F|nr:uncharacterized protein LOC129302282 isoform X2 [Prosopis cineraria]